MFRTLGINRNFLGIPSANSSFANSKIIVLPVPYEHAVSYGAGTKFGPEAILNASHYVEFYDEETQKEIYLEHGIATLQPLKLEKKKDETALTMIYDAVLELLEHDKFIVMLGGEHTITQASVAAFAKKYKNLSILHFDAHSDLREEYLGNKYSHASVMARVCEIIDPSKLVQVGIRAQCIEEARFIKENKVNTFYAHQIRNWKDNLGFVSWEESVINKLSENVYLSFDLDVFDPSLMPSTGTPEPNGLFWNEVINCIRRVARKRNIVGCDVVELMPIKNLHHSDVTAAKLVSKIINFAVK